MTSGGRRTTSRWCTSPSRGSARTASACCWCPTPGSSSPSTSTTSSGPPCAATTPASASWRSRWRASCDPATSRRGSAPARPPRPWQPLPRPRWTRSCRTPRRSWPSASTSRSGPSEPRSAARHRRARPPTGSRTLGDAVGGHLRAQNVDPGGVDWDAWRREDGRWTLTAAFSSQAREGQAAFTFDAPGNYVSADDDDARWLIGDTVAGAVPQRAVAVTTWATTTSPPYAGAGWPPYPPTSSRSARTPSTWSATSRWPSIPTRRPRTGLTGRRGTGGGLPRRARPADPDLRAGPRRCRRGRTRRRRADDEPAGRPARRKGRASVPSWDEIMFGGGKHD